MKSLVQRVVRGYRTGGLKRVLARSVPVAYDRYVRPHLPRRLTVYNGVVVNAARSLDTLVPWFVYTHPSPDEYEAALVDGIERWVADGDTAVVVGGGWGVSTVVAARRVGETGEVHTFEGSSEYADRVRETARLNGVSDSVTVHEAVVSHAVELKAGSSRLDRHARTIPPADLPDCDVLVLDCEGAETAILDSLAVEPRVIIVETHGRLGAPEEAVRTLLEARSYDVVSRSPAEVGRLEALCIENGVFVLVATR